MSEAGSDPGAWTSVPAEVDAIAYMQAVVASWTSVLYAAAEDWPPAGGHDPAK